MGSQNSSTAAMPYVDRIRLAIARAAHISELSREGFHQRCEALVSHSDEERADYLLAASNISGVSVGVLLNEQPLAHEVADLARRVNHLESGAS
jgi:hypothetical protein